MSEPVADAEFEELLEYIRRSRGFDFTGYKRTTLVRRVRHRMNVINVAGFRDYVAYLEAHTDEFALLFNTVLINVTEFFRDPQAWEYLGQEIIPAIIAQKGKGEPVRFWCPGCATGEEAYSLAILLAEALGLEDFNQRAKIYATDVDEEALASARHAAYAGRSVQTVAEDLRAKYFELSGTHYVFRSDLRRAVIFGRHDLVQDAPISRLDLLSCRNTLMYFNSETQTRILSRFHYALNDDGYLFLGRAELLLTHSQIFSPVNLRYRVFAKVPRASGRERLLAVIPAPDEPVGDWLTRQTRLRDSAFDGSPLAQLVVDSSGRLVLANAQARALFRLTVQSLGQPLRELDICRPVLDLPALVEQACDQGHPQAVADVRCPMEAGKSPRFDVQVIPLAAQGGAWLGATLVFEDRTQDLDLQEHLGHARSDLEAAYEEIQSGNEELTTTNEELQSTVEELETTNEELQSTNEELETMHEELGSSGEELQTMNSELQERSKDLDREGALLGAVIGSLSGALIAVDERLTVRLWNREAEELWGLPAGEAIGRALADLDSGLPVQGLLGPLRAIVSGHSAREQVEMEAINRRGRTIRLRVTLTPLVGAGAARPGAILLLQVVT